MRQSKFHLVIIAGIIAMGCAVLMPDLSAAAKIAKAATRKGPKFTLATPIFSAFRAISCGTRASIEYSGAVIINATSFISLCRWMNPTQ